MRDLIRDTGPGVVGVRQVQVPHSTLFGQHHHTDDTTGAAIPLDGLLQGTAHKVDTLCLRHVLFPVRIGITVDVGRS